jgi:ubiquinone biosynthesis protein
MNSLQALSLIRELYFKKGLPDLKKIESYGLLAVKIGQMHALRLDFLSPEKCQELSKLYRSNIPVPAEEIEILLSKQGGPEFKKNFSEIMPTPLAVASVGQVYRAKLMNSTEVVIKIIKARFKERFTTDVSKLRRFFKLALRFNPRLKGVGNPLGILDDIEQYTLAELDLTREINGLTELKNIYEDNKERFDLSMLGFQKIYQELSSENILVSDFVDAPTVDELLEQKRFTYDNMLKLFYVQGFYIFVAGKFHGDLHPGNVLYDGKKFYFVDMAFIGQVGDRIRRGLFYFFEALSRYDYSECAKWLNEMAEQGLTGEKYDDFQLKLLDLYKDFTDKTVSQVSLTKQMMLTIKLGVNSGMVFEKGIFAIIRSLMYLDGMVLKCNPDAVLMKDMRQFVEKYKKFIN